MADPTLSACNVLVTGSNGCLGRNVLLALISRNGVAPERIHAFSLHAPSDATRIAGVNYHQGDTSDAAAVSRAMSQAHPALVIHTAGVSAFLGSDDTYQRVNVQGTRNVLEAAQSTGVKAFVHTSSASVVDDGYSDLINVNESAPVLAMKLEFDDAYNYSKAVSEDLVLSANRHAGMLTAALRVSLLFGPSDKQATLKMVQAAKAGQLAYQLGNNQNHVNPVYTDNAADCHVLAGKVLLQASGRPPASDTDRVDGEAFFLTNGTTLPFWDFSRRLGAAAGYPTDLSTIRVIPKAVAMTGASVVDWIKWMLSFGQKKQQLRKTLGYSVRWRTFDISKAKDRLGYEPAVGLDEAIARAGAAFQE